MCCRHGQWAGVHAHSEKESSQVGHQGNIEQIGSPLSDKPALLKWDQDEQTSSTENFWPDVHSYKDPLGNFPFQLFSLGVLKMFGPPVLIADSKWRTRQILKL